MNEGFNIIYAKKMSRPKNIYLENRINVINFMIEYNDDIDFLSINEVIIDKNKLINDNKLLSRIIKMKKINNIT